MRKILMGLLLLVGLCLIPQQAEATVWYADSSCANNGNGLADQCAASNGAAGAFNGQTGANNAVQRCFNAMFAGDVCYVKNGAGIYEYDSAGVSGYRDDSGFHPIRSGGSGSKITLSAYPGHTPTLRNCSTYVATECQGATITANGQSHIRITGFNIIGAIHAHHTSSGAGCVGCVTGWEIDHNTISIGWFGDGNWSFIFLEGHTFAWIHHNLLQNMDVSNDQIQDQGSAIKFYHVYDTITEFNTHLGQNFEATGVDDKENGNRNIIRYNYVDNINGAAYQLCFYAVAPENICTGNQVYGNIAINAGNLVTVQGGSGAGSATNTDVYNNTGRNILVFGEQRSDGNLINYRRWNNILVATIDNDYMYRPGEAPDFSDYNIWTAGQGFDLGGTGYANLAALKSGGGTLDDNSTDTAPSFVSSTDHHTTGFASTFCHVGGVSGGAVVACGAYGVTDCVGYQCSGGGGGGGSTSNRGKGRTRMRGKEASMWPFIGIPAAIFVFTQLTRKRHLTN